MRLDGWVREEGSSGMGKRGGGSVDKRGKDKDEDIVYGNPLTGISGTSKTNFGTCLALSSSLIAPFTRFTKASVNASPSLITKNNMTLSSRSRSRFCPTHRESFTSLPKSFSMILYISALPNRTPLGFNTPSARPWKCRLWVSGWKDTKSPCVQT